MVDMELKSVEKIKALIESIETVTGESYEDLTEAVQALKDYYLIDIITGYTFCDNKTITRINIYLPHPMVEFSATFSGASSLKYIKGINLSKCQRMINTFLSCPVEVIEEPCDVSSLINNAYNHTFIHANRLKEIRFILETIKANIAFGSYVLSGESIQSIFGGLNSEATGNTLTLRRNAVKKAFETSEGANDGDTSETWNALVASKPNWTITLN